MVGHVAAACPQQNSPSNSVSQFVGKKFSHYVCKLNESVCGLRQSILYVQIKRIYTMCTWFQMFSKLLMSNNFFNRKSDSSMFILSSSNDCLVLLVYVDDIIITGSGDSMIPRFLNNLNKAFPIIDLGDLHYFFGYSS